MSSIPVQFQLDDQQPVEYKLSPTCTLTDFTRIIKNIYKERYWMYSFICHGKMFDLQSEEEFQGMKRLITPKTTLFAVVRTKGGGFGFGGSRFVNVHNNNLLKRYEWSDKAPVWRVVRPGLCLEGYCQNVNCTAYNHQVIINIGLVKFDLNLQKAALSKCPQCQKYVNPITCAFNRCRWKYHGQLELNKNEVPSSVKTNWKTADDAYYRFDSDTEEPVTWLQLIFEARAK
ncbi:unnamed protein product [Adineta ricciae]|uniref:Ubiquitin-like domain-containing protein n=1 Tax=Adineta ricciae TaxID=249248 RepID=A0A815TE71_ADIRI|nr:unnamed protein product [Adineta ricciae]CAF1500845.1 unnamed protein product [Adineta ricciae]